LRTHRAHRHHIVQINPTPEGLVFEKVPDLWGECRKLRWKLYRLGNTPGIVADQFLGGLWLWHLVVALDNLLQGDDVMPFIAEGLVVWIIGSEREQHGLKGHHLERSYFVGQTLFSYHSGRKHGQADIQLLAFRATHDFNNPSWYFPVFTRS